jgi:hypothetical protein
MHDAHARGADTWLENYALTVAGPVQPWGRTVPRGQQRALESADMVAAIQRCTNYASVVDGESLSLWAPLTMLWNDGRQSYEQRFARTPRWWRGEQRRRVARNRQAWEATYGRTIDPRDGTVLRSIDETDAQFRQRILDQVNAMPGIDRSGWPTPDPTPASVLAAVLAMAGVTAAAWAENGEITAMSVSATFTIPHSIEVILDDGGEPAISSRDCAHALDSFWTVDCL